GSVVVTAKALLRLDQVRFHTLGVIADKPGDLHADQQARREQHQSQIASQHRSLSVRFGLRPRIRRDATSSSGQPVAITEQAVEHAFAAVLAAGFDQGRQQLFDLDRLWKTFTHPVQQIAEGRFAVGVPHRPIERGAGVKIR
nr:hypothetical protein [Tanacetum cinerariifolium]